MLYQKVRPKKLTHMFGNEATIDSIAKLLQGKDEDRPHALLLSGPTGCGKTTLARIICSELGCSDFGIFEMNAANTAVIYILGQNQGADNVDLQWSVDSMFATFLAC